MGQDERGNDSGSVHLGYYSARGRLFPREGVALNVSLGYGKETLSKSASEMMKCKAHGAQNRAKRQTVVGWPRRGEKPKGASQPEPMGICEDSDGPTVRRSDASAPRNAVIRSRRHLCSFSVGKKPQKMAYMAKTYSGMPH
jgi:hypothetical protein